MKQICMVRVLILILIVGMADAGYAQLVGKFNIPDTLSWERMTELDESMIGPVIAVKPSEGPKIFISFNSDPVECTAGNLDFALQNMHRSFQEEFPDGDVFTLPMGKRSCYMVKGEQPENGITVYYGCTNADLDAYTLLVIQKGLGDLPEDFKRFFSKISTETELAQAADASAAGLKKELPEWIAGLPEIPVVKPVKITAPADYSKLNRTRYAGVVRSAKAGVRELLGPMDPAAEKRFNKAWDPMFDYPAEECTDYLEKLIPLVEKSLGLRAALSDSLRVYEALWRESGYAAYYDTDAARILMETVASEAAKISSLKEAVQAVSEQLAALGDPPNPEALKAVAAGRHRRAMGTLESLLGKSAPLAGRYERIGMAALNIDENTDRSPSISRVPVEDRMERLVIKPLKRQPGESALFYCFTETEQGKDSDSDIFSFDFDPQNWWVEYAEPRGGGWATYDYDDEDGEVSVTFYHVDADRLSADWFSIVGGRVTSAQRTVYERVPEGTWVKEYPDGESEASIKKIIAGGKEELAGTRTSYLKGRKAFAAYTAAAGHLPDVAGPEQLYWVLTDVRLSRRIDDKTTVVDDSFEEQYIRTTRASTSDSSFEVAWNHIKKEYEYQSSSAVPSGSSRGDYISNPDAEEDAGPYRKLVREETEEGKASVTWTPPPAIVPDGSSWALHPNGSGAWGFFINGTYDDGGGHASGQDKTRLWGGPALAMDSRQDHFFIWEDKASPAAEISLVNLTPDDRPLMDLTCSKGQLSASRFIQFRSDGVTQNQEKYIIPIVVTCAAGGMKVEYEYALKILDEDQALAVAAKGGARLNTADLSVKTDRAAIDGAEAAKENADERIAMHKANIAYCKQTLQRLSGREKELKAKLMAGTATSDDIEFYKQTRFMIAAQKSEIVTENDRIREVQTGKPVFSRTPFDDMCRAQVVRNAEAEVRELDRASRGMKKAQWLASKLGPGQRAKANKLINDCIANGGAVDPKAWNKLNAAMTNLYQGEQQLKLAKIEEDIAWKQAQLSAVENVKTGADVAMTLMPMAGGPMAVAAAYQTGCGFAEGGIMEGVKRGLSTYSDAADVAISTYDGWKAGGWLGAMESASWSILMNKGPEAAMGRLNMRTSSGFDDGFKQINVEVKAKTNRGAEAIAAAKFQQEMEYGKALGEDFFHDYKTLRTAELKKTASKAELDQMRMAVRQKAAAVNSSMTAKNYLKYGAEPIKGKAYADTMDDILGDTVAAYNWEMRNQGYNEQTLYHCRNASSTGAGMDADLALKEQPRIIPVKGKDGKITYKRNHWLKKNGNPVSLAKYQKEGSEVLAAAYKKVTGGYSAKQSFVDMTTKLNPESYPDTTWLQLPKAGAHSDINAVNRQLDDFFGKIDPDKLPATLNVTVTKAEIMFKEHPELRKLGSMMETCRGTAKDLDTKFIPLVESRIRTLEAKPDMGPADRKKLSELITTRDQLKSYRKCFVEIGQGKIPPYEWNHRFRMVTGGQDTVSVVRRLAKITELAAK